MIKFVKRVIQWNWWNELISLTFAIPAFVFFPYLAIQLESDPSVFSVGILHKLIFGFIVFSMANGLGGLFVKLVVPNIFNFKNDEFPESFKSLNPFQKCIVLILFFAVYFFGFILSVTTL